MAERGVKTKVGQDKSDLVEQIPMACACEKSAVEFFENQRWSDGAGCPCCGSTNVYQMTDSKTGERQKNYRWRCRDCKKQFTVRTGTVMEESRIPLRHWAYAFWRACSSKKGVSALEIKRQTGLSYKSALFLMHRIRYAMAPTQDAPKLTGTVEADETYVGGKPRHRQSQSGMKRKTSETNYDTIRDRKTPVFAAVERGGQCRVRVLPNVTGANLREMVKAHIDTSARLMTDEHAGYVAVGREFEGGHGRIKHKQKIYVRGDITTNTVESFFAILKRGVIGVYHNVSRKHMQRYLDEFEFRYNHRKNEDGERTVAAIRGSEGKRLTRQEVEMGL